MQPVVILGPQRLAPLVGDEVAARGLKGPVAMITAGWQEREREDEEFRQILAVPAINLELYGRWEDIREQDPAYFVAHRSRQDRLRQIRNLYQLRMAHLMAQAREIFELAAEEAAADVLEPEKAAVIADLQALDAHHLARVEEENAAFDAEWRTAERPVIARHRADIAARIAACEAVAMAGGHIAVLLNRLRLFDLEPMLREKLVFAWSAGAMALTDRILLFHDDPPQGTGHAELFEQGLGLVPGVVILPMARRRLSHEDPLGTALLARRLSPALCVPMDERERLVFQDGRLTPGEGLRRLDDAGRVVGFRSGEPLAPPAPPLPEITASDDGNEPEGRTPPGAFERLLQQDPLDDAAIREFLARHSFPLVEGRQVTFVYYGPADAAYLRHFVFGLPSVVPFHRAKGTDLWYCRLDIPARSRVEYKIDVVREGRGEWIRDPLNPRFARDPFGANSVCQGEGYELPEWIKPDPESRPGELQEVVFRHSPWGDARRVTLYLPARFRRSRRYPLLLVHDGSDYVRFASLKTILDNLIHRGEVAPLIAALTHPVDRMTEYPDDPRHAQFLSEVLTPWLEARYPLFATPAHRCLMGASFGAVASLSTAWRYPGMFGRLLLQSGSFAFTDIGENKRGPAFEPVVRFVNAFRAEPGRPSEQVFVSCGQYESLIYENRSMAPFLKDTGMKVRYVEAPDGHNWENWRDRLREGLSWLFPGHLWMVYE